MTPRTCHLTIIDPACACDGPFYADRQRSAVCPRCGSPLFERPVVSLSQIGVYRWFAALPAAEQQQIFEDLARLRARVGPEGGAA
jgi:hypothetical protein